MAAGDWLLGCIPLQQTDTGLFNRAYYLSGSYGLWRPVLTVGLGAIGGFLYYSDYPYMGGSHGVVCRLSGAAYRSRDPHGHVSFIVQAERYLDLMKTFLQRNGI